MLQGEFPSGPAGSPHDSAAPRRTIRARVTPQPRYSDRGQLPALHRPARQPAEKTDHRRQDSTGSRRVPCDGRFSLSMPPVAPPDRRRDYRIGYDAPEVESVRADISYVTRIFVASPVTSKEMQEWSSPTPPQGKRLKASCWRIPRRLLDGHTSAACWANGCRTDSEAIRPLPARFRGQTSTTSSGAPRRSVTWRVSHFWRQRRLHHERLQRFPRLVLVLGDALCSSSIRSMARA